MDGSILTDTIGLTGRDLKSAMASMKLVVERRNATPQLGMAMIRSGSRQIIGTDLDMQLTVPFGGEGSLARTVLVPIDHLSRLSKTLSSREEMMLSSGISKGGYTPIKIAFNDGETSLSGLNPIDFPAMKFTRGSIKPIEIDAQNFVQSLGRVAHCISTEETRYYLNGVDIRTVDEPDGRALRLCATDGHRLGIRLIRGLVDLPEIDGYILPHKAVKTLLAVIGSQNGTLRIEFADKPVMRITFCEQELITKAIDGTFPNVERVLPDGNTAEIMLPRLESIAAIKRVAAIDHSQYGPAIKFEALHGIGIFSTETPDGDAASMRVSVAGSIPYAVGMRAKYILDVLHALDGPNVRCLFDGGTTGHMTAMKFVEPDQESAGQFVLMPMRI